MANQEHEKLLQQGSNVWNAWRRQHPKVDINLSDADLSDANLSDAIFFSNIYVPRAFGGTIVLSKPADLRGADLSQANLRGAKFTDEQLDQAKSLKGANMPDGTIYLDKPLPGS